MRKTTKIWLVIAAFLTIGGLVMFTAVMSACHWDFGSLSTVTYITTTQEIHETFHSLSIDTVTADVTLVPSPDDKCRVEWITEEHTDYAVTVQDGTLTVQYIDNRSDMDYIHHIGIYGGAPCITVYLPQAQYQSLSVTASTGAIRAENLTADTLALSVTTGRIAVSDVTCQGTVTADVTTGRTNIANLYCKNLLSNGATGDIKMKNVIAADSFSIQRTTGDVNLDRCDASEIYIKTTTGDVNGSLLSEKNFIAQTNTGDVTVPRICSGGICQIDTSTGDIYITLVS